MLLRFKKMFIIFNVIFSTSLLFSGSDFFAIRLGLHKNLVNDIKCIQQYIKNNLPKDLSFSPTSVANLHITLKEIGDLDPAQRTNIRKDFRKLAKKHKGFVINKKALSKGFIKVNKKGQVLFILKPNSNLTNLAKNINTKLEKHKETEKIKTLFKRFDFPNYGHITLGQITKKNKPLKKIDKYKKEFHDLAKNFVNPIKTDLPINYFVLLKSNSPLEPRVYEYKGIFHLSK